MEVNPLPGLHPEHSDLPILCTLAGISYHELMGMIMQSAMRRIDCSQSLQHSIMSDQLRRELLGDVNPAVLDS